MAAGYVLYNKKAGGSENQDICGILNQMMDCTLTFIDITRVTNYRRFFCGLEPEDFVIVAGGDGTLNRFVNDTVGISIPCQILYFPNGAENRFAKSMRYEKGCHPFPITQYIMELPTVTVMDQNFRFLHGVGFGLEGFCGEMRDDAQNAAREPVSDKKMIRQGILFRYMPTGATVTVDGVTNRYKKVWMASAARGKQGGEEVVVMVCHDIGRWKALRVIPSLLEGKEIQHEKMVAWLRGKEITVEFDEPRSLQIDGETMLRVRSYQAKAPVKVVKTV